jgi:hypothetical protein
MTNVDPEQLQAGPGIYTDDRVLVVSPGWRLVSVPGFHRSLLIELKQCNVFLYGVERTAAL